MINKTILHIKKPPEDKETVLFGKADITNENWTFSPSIDVFDDETEILRIVRDPIKEEVIFIEEEFYDDEQEEDDYDLYFEIMSYKGEEI